MSISDYNWSRPFRAYASTWTSLNPILRQADVGIEKNTDRFKIGDGTTAWNDLHYHESTFSILAQAADLFAAAADLDDDVAALINDGTTPSAVRAALDALYTGGGGFSGDGADLTGGPIPTAVLGSGTASSTTFLRGDNTWATPADGGGSLDDAGVAAAIADDTTPSATRAALDADFVADADLDDDVTALINDSATPSDVRAALDALYTGGGGLDDAGVAALVNDDTTPSDTRAALDAIYAAIGSGGTVDSIVPGTGISVDDTDPANPIVSATGGGGGGAQVDVYTTAQSATAWAKPAGAVKVQVDVMAGGGGGGSGRKGPAGAGRAGGSGGGRGGFHSQTYDAADLPSTLYVWVGAGGTGGASQTTNTTNGSDGTNGSDSFVSTSSSATLATARALAVAAGKPGGQGKAGTTTTAAAGAAGPGLTTTGGTGGAASATAGGSDGLTGGGGGGGGINSSNSRLGTGSASAYTDTTSFPAFNNPAPTLSGGAGVDASTLDSMTHGPIPGIGGSGGAASLTTNAGAGGAGIYGGGGGGGGAAVDSVGNSGAGGAGGTGYVILTSYF